MFFMALKKVNFCVLSSFALELEQQQQQDFFSSLFWGVVLAKISIKIPPRIPLIKAAHVLIIAIGHPKIPAVSIILSMPVWGVAIKKAAVELLFAPSFFKAEAIGITPQEQIGNGIPNKTAFYIGGKPLPPKFFFIVSGEIKQAITPEIKYPNKSHGAIAQKTSTKHFKKLRINI